MSLRIALYSPGMVGLGHVRRNLMLARQFSADFPEADLLLITEAREACAFQLPSGADCVSLPGLRKDARQGCAPRHLRASLSDVVQLRAAVIEATLSTVDPDVVIIDHLARGALGELEPALHWLRRRGRARLVLGLRDVLDEPATVRREWQAARVADAIKDYYQQVWIYGDPAVFDPVHAYSLPPSISEKVRYAGYLDPRVAHPQVAESVELLAQQTVDDRQLVLCQMGGGQDGNKLAEAFVRVDFPTDMHGLLLTGPFMAPAERASLRNRVRMNPRLEVVDFIAEPMLLLQKAARVITMGGYNSVCEVLAFQKRALVVPRTRPRCEQRMRAERLARRGLIEVLLPEAVTAEAISDWLSQELAEPARGELAIDGLARASGFVRELLADLPPAAARTAGTPNLQLAIMP